MTRESKQILMKKFWKELSTSDKKVITDKLSSQASKQWKNVTPEMRKQISLKIGEANNKRVWKKSSIKKLKRTKREFMIKNIEERKLNGLPLIPMFGINETKILNNIERKQNIKIIRQYRVAGFFLDGYCKETNVAYEVDELHHFNLDGNLCEDDIQRQHVIEKELNCNFIRIKSVTENDN